MVRQALWLTAAADIPDPILGELSTSLSAVVPVEDGGRVVMLSAEPPQFIQILGDALTWTNALKAASAIYLGQLAKNAADDTWKHKRAIFDGLKSGVARPLAVVVQALRDVRTKLRARSSVVVGLNVPQSAFGAVFATESADEAELAWHLAQFVLRVDRIQAVIDAEMKGEQAPLGRVHLAIQPDGAILVRWVTRADMDDWIERKIE
jgi:hypothetical protein